MARPFIAARRRGDLCSPLDRAMEAERESIDPYQARRREGARGFTRTEDLLRNLLRMMESGSRNAADAVVLLRSEFCGR